MAPPPRQQQKQQDVTFENRRALLAFGITLISLALLIGVIIHAKWALNVLIYKQYGNFLNNLVFGVGTLIANAGLSLRFVSYLNLRFLDSRIDADHKKYV